MQEGDPHWQLSSKHMDRSFHPPICTARGSSKGVTDNLRAKEPASLGSEGGHREEQKTTTCKPHFPLLSPDPSRRLQEAPSSYCRVDEEGPFTGTRERQYKPSVMAGAASPSVIQQRCSRLQVVGLWNGKSQSASVQALPHRNYGKVLSAIYIHVFADGITKGR